MNILTAVSGGSILAASYALRGVDGLPDFETRFLNASMQQDLEAAALTPRNLWRLQSPRFGRSDLLAEHLDERLFTGATFANLPTAIGVYAAGRHAAPLAARAALILAVLSTAAMMAGLLRWPSLHWQLALAYADASPAAREAIAAVFAASNSYLGNFVGELLGELFLNSFFLCAAIVLTRAAAPARRWLLVAGASASLLGGLAMLRNVTTWVEPIVALNNVVLPIWMLVLGAALVRHRTSPHELALPTPAWATRP